MAQYKTGTVSVTNGSATVTGSGTSWSGEIAAGDLFTIVGDNAWYEVASVGSNTSITLSANYAGTTGSGKSYAISRDFTTRLALPYPQKGDIETASIIKRAFEQIDTETNIATANYSATSAPTANDDSGDGYSIGSWWVNVTSDEAYLCVDATVGSAVWTKISVDVPSEIVSLLAGQSVSMASLTLSGGTANGVLYLNGSKVATSGSALTFDGTNFATTGKIGAGGNPGTYTQIWSTGNVMAVDGSQIGFLASSSGAPANYMTGSNASNYLAWIANNSEAMRLTSIGLGVGTSSPGYKVDATVSTNGVNGYNAYGANGGAAEQIGYRAVNANNTGLFAGVNGFNYSGSFGTPNGAVITSIGNVALAFGTNNTERLRLDPSGNLGLGVTPSAWAASALDIGGWSSFAQRNTNGWTLVGGNVYWDGSNYRYKNSSTAALYELRGPTGVHAWFTAASGTAGDAITFTQAMTLGSDGTLGVGTTSAVAADGTLVAAGSNGTGQGAANTVAQINIWETTSGNKAGLWFGAMTNSNVGVIGSRTASGAIAFQTYNGGWGERARIDSSGNLLVGATSFSFASNGTQIASTGRIFNTSNTDYNFELSGSSSARIRFYSSAGGNGTTAGSITVDTTNTQYNTSSDYRLKNITGPITNSGEYIDSLNPVEGTWKIDGSTFVGLIAHEVQEVSRTNVATGVKDGEQMQGMDYSSAEIIANLIAEVKSLRARVASLES